MKEPLNFQYPTQEPSIIKVIGVGGGGGNAVTHMYREGIYNVDFVLCNTDRQALDTSDVPTKIQLGEKGLGAGNDPEKARLLAEESEDKIRSMLSDGTEMVFITAGMGGGTGTGAAPVIARMAKEQEILTIAIVTIPFMFEGRRKILQALHGVQEISKSVDALLVVNNERLRWLYRDLTVDNAFKKADDTLTIAAKSIAEIITLPGQINLDFADVKATLKDGGVAIMSNGVASGDDRLAKAIDTALSSPLLNNKDVFNARKILLNVVAGTSAPLMMDEMENVDDFMNKFNDDIHVIWGRAIDESLGENIKVIILATGFEVKRIPGMDAKQQMDKEKEDELIRDYYPWGEIKKNPIILDNEALDNDRIIDLISNHPTYDRKSHIKRQVEDLMKEDSSV
ncbi:MAG: cell division protein FtsZ [Dysgonamonadaceae bacterium]|nr:cell division protein FtsZ [Dysgonamonadaceae bacterium]